MKKIKAGYQVVDIGPDGRPVGSDFYRAEQQAVREMGAAKMTIRKFPNDENVADMRTRLCIVKIDYEIIINAKG